MKTMLIAGLVITFPAILVVLTYMGTTIALAALASLAVNSLPFFVGGLILRKASANASDADAH